MAVFATYPVTIPVEEPTDATSELLLVQVPPPASVSVVLALTQTVAAPVIEEGSGLRVIGAVVLQPVGSVYVIVALP